MDLTHMLHMHTLHINTAHTTYTDTSHRQKHHTPPTGAHCCIEIKEVFLMAFFLTHSKTITCQHKKKTPSITLRSGKSMQTISIDVIPSWLQRAGGTLGQVLMCPSIQSCSQKAAHSTQHTGKDQGSCHQHPTTLLPDTPEGLQNSPLNCRCAYLVPLSKYQEFYKSKKTNKRLHKPSSKHPHPTKAMIHGVGNVGLLG